MNPGIGMLGAFLLAIGGVMVSLSLGALIRGTSNFGYILGDFMGFLLLGVGLWLIVQSGRGETRQPLPNMQ